MSANSIERQGVYGKLHLKEKLVMEWEMLVLV